MPRVGDEQRHVAGRAFEDHGWATVVGQVDVVHAIERRQPARTVTSGNNRRRSVGERAVLQEDVRADREHRIRDAVVPGHIFGPRDVRSGVGVPEATGELRRVAPRGVGDHVAVVAEERLDHLEDARMRDHALARGAAVQHLVAELVLVVADPFRADRVEHVVDLRAQLRDVGCGEDAPQDGAAVALELGRRLGRIAAEHGEVLAQAPDHDRTLRVHGRGRRPPSSAMIPE